MLKSVVQNRFFKTASLVGVLTVLSKILGLGRDLVIAHFYGTGMEADSFNLAYLFTGNFFIIFGCIGGPFYSTVVATLPKIKNNIWDFLKTILIKVSIALLGLYILIYFFKAYLLKYFIDIDAKPEYFELTLQNIDILLPLIFLCGPAGILFAVLNIYKKYYEPSLAPAVINITLIATVFIAGDTLFAIALALGTSLGAVLSIIFQFPSLMKIRKEIDAANDPSCSFKKTDFYQILFPALMTTGISQVMVFVDSFFCKGLEAGSWTSVVLANRLVQMPLGVLLTAFLVPIFPRVTEMANLKDFAGIKRLLTRSLGVLMTVCFPAVLVGIFFSEDLIRLVFEHGAFDSRSTAMVSSLFFYLCFSIISYALRDSFTRTLYSLGDSKTPLFIMLFAIVLKYFLNSILVPKFGLDGIGISTTLISYFNALCLFVLMNWQMNKLQNG